MDPYHILLIAPYSSLVNKVKQVCQGRENIILDVEVGNLEEGAEIAKNIKGNYDAILSRGGTKLAIDKVTNLPVFSIPVSIVEILNLLKLVEAYKEKFAIVAYPDIASVVTQICQILQYDYDIFYVHSIDESKATINHLKDRHYKLIIGDTICVQYSEEIGLNAMLITSGQESINAVLDEIVTYLSQVRSLKGNLNTLQNILKTTCSLHVVLNAKGNLIYSDDVEPGLVNLCSLLVPQLSQKGELKLQKKQCGRVFRIQGKVIQQEFYFEIKEMPISHGQVHSFRNITLVSMEDEKTGDHLRKEDTKYLYTPLFDRINQQLALDMPLILTGESGSGIHSLTLELMKSAAPKPLYQINCFGLTSLEKDFLFSKEDSPFYDENIGLLIRHLEALKDEDFVQLLECLIPMAQVKNHLLLMSFELGLMESAKERFRLNMIKNKLLAREERITPLREREEEIASYVVFRIQKLNQDLNTEIIGIEPEALALLEKHPWPRNLDELNNVLQVAMKMAKSPWLTVRNISFALGSESIPERSSDLVSISRNKSFEEIKRDIFRLVYREENFNQQKTANRLGISRTTLWRTLKDDQDF